MFTSHQKLHFLLFFTLLLSHARSLTLHPSDATALSALLGLPTLCSFSGVFCERRLSDDDDAYVLRVTRLILNSRGLTGPLSPAIGRLSELKELSLSANNLVDLIPAQVSHCKKLEILDLSNNHFSGEVPINISSLLRLRHLNLSSNHLAGKLNFLRYFPNLETLSVANNSFSGKIPKSIRSFRNLRLFDFTGNLIEDSPPLMTSANYSPTRRFMLSNNTNNRIPAQAPASSPPSSSTSSQHNHNHTHNHNHKKKKLKKAMAWIVGFIAGAFGGAFSGFVFSMMFKTVIRAARARRRRDNSGISLFSPLIKNPEDLSFLEKEEGLACFERIGKGGCGEVYKTQLQNGLTLAIKKVYQPAKDAADMAEEESKLLHKKMRQIRSEINTVGHIRHRNLLPLLAHISRPECHYLVYEFMKNGSLQDVLNQVRSGVRVLTWGARHKISLGVARGLEYLHIQHNPRIIHRDLKPGNVLLDDEMEPRIADFGFAKAFPDGHTHISGSNVAGTVGYIAPEYHQTLKFTDKADIYSFGVLLGVLVMGKLPSDEFFQHTEEMSMVKWMRNVMSSEDPKEAIDVELRGNGNEEQMLLFLKIACFCTVDKPQERPDAKNVRLMLSQL